MSSTIDECSLPSRIYASLRDGARREGVVEEEVRSGPGNEAWETLTEADPTAIDLEDLLEYMDASDLLLFSDERDLAPCREYVAAYLTSRPRENPPVLALGLFQASTVERALARWNVDPGPGEMAIQRFFEILEKDLGSPLPAGYPDLLRIALHLDLPLLGVRPGERDARGSNEVEALYSKLRVNAHRRPVIGLVPTAFLRPDHVQQHLLHAHALETRVVYQSLPELYFRFEERGLPTESAFHLLGSWAFATMATHPIFHVAAQIAAHTGDVLLPPRPAHSPRRLDAPMVELLLGAAELLKDTVFPNLRSPESVQILTFLEDDLEAKLALKGFGKHELENTLTRVARGECVPLPERNLVVIGAPLLGPAVEALYRVLVATEERCDRYPETIAPSIVCWALAFFGSSLVAGRRDWPEPDDAAFDPLFEHVLERLERSIEEGEPLPSMALEIDRPREELEELSCRLGRFLGARLVLTSHDAQQLGRASTLLQHVYEGASPLENLLELGQLALRDENH